MPWVCAHYVYTWRSLSTQGLTKRPIHKVHKGNDIFFWPLSHLSVPSLLQSLDPILPWLCVHPMDPTGALSLYTQGRTKRPIHKAHGGSDLFSDLISVFAASLQQVLSVFLFLRQSHSPFPALALSSPNASISVLFSLSKALVNQLIHNVHTHKDNDLLFWSLFHIRQSLPPYPALAVFAPRIRLAPFLSARHITHESYRQRR